MAKVLVYNKKTKDERFMGEDQFKNWGSKNGFELVPEGSKNKTTDDSGNTSTKDVKTGESDKTDTSGDSGSLTDTKEVKKSTKVADIVAEIEAISKDEALSDEEKIEKINTFSNNETRSGVIKAVEKFGKQTTEKDA